MLVNVRAVAAALVAVLSVSPVSLCAGWQATPEARMACCLEGAACPMHPSDADGPGATRAVTQAEADSCCAAGEPDDASPSAKPLTAVNAVAIATPSLLLPPQLDTRASRTVAVPNRAHPVSRHLLLSVFIV